MQTTNNTQKAVTAAAIGNALEWYDFSVFAYFAAYIAHSFFVQGDETSALINTFLIFGVGFIARPLGALFLGIYGDKVGRKAALTLTIALMAIGTLIISIAPPIWAIGVGAPILLLIGRLFQGFSAGGEIGGAIAFLVESAPAKRKASYTAWMQASMGASNILAGLVGLTVTSLFDDEQIRQWAWRLPFLFGLLIIPVGFYIRRTLNETSEFIAAKAEQKTNTPVKAILRQYPRQFVVGILLSILWTLSVYTLIIYMPTYYASAKIGLGFSKNNAFLAAFIGNIFLVAGCLWAGRVADRIGVFKVITAGTIGLLVGIYPLLAWLHSAPTVLNLVLVQSAFCLIISLLLGVAPLTLANLFPTAVRSTGMSLTYNIAAIFFAGFTPALLTWATSFSLYAPAIYISLASLVGLVAIGQMRKFEASSKIPTELVLNQ